MDIDAIFKVPYLIVGAIGGAISIVFGDKKPKTLREYTKASAFIMAGAIITNFLTPLAIKIVPLLDGVEHGTSLIIGLFGIGMAQALFKVLNDLKTDFYGTIRKLKDMFKE